MDAFKKHIQGFHRNGFTCPCCRETDKHNSKKLARSRLKAQDRRELDDMQT